MARQVRLKKLIYKSQLPPTFEPYFYEHAMSKLLPVHQVIGILGKYTTMLIDWIDAPLLSNVVLPANELIFYKKSST